MNILTIAFLAQAMLLSGTTGGSGQNCYGAEKNSEDRVGTETIQKSLRLSSGGTILLDTELGNVTIAEYDGRDVKVELQLEGTPEDVSRFHFTHDYFGNQVTLKGWYGEKGEAQDPRFREAHFTIMVPRDSSYSIRTDTKLGNIKAVLSQNTKAVDLSADAGSVWVKIPCDIAATLDASTSGIGGVELTPEELVAKLCFTSEVLKSDHVKGKMHGGGPEINAYAGAGNVRFEIVQGKQKNPS
jgi:hypothetical protein